MAQLRNALRACLLRATSPSAALRSLNEFAILLLPTVFATAIVACIDSRTGEVTVASAGHLIPYLVSAGQKAIAAPVQTSPPLGLPEAHYRESSLTVRPGEGVIFFSDGLIERRSEGIESSLSRFASTLGLLGLDQARPT